MDGGCRGWGWRRGEWSCCKHPRLSVADWIGRPESATKPTLMNGWDSMQVYPSHLYWYVRLPLVDHASICLSDKIPGPPQPLLPQPRTGGHPMSALLIDYLDHPSLRIPALQVVSRSRPSLSTFRDISPTSFPSSAPPVALSFVHHFPVPVVSQMPWTSLRRSFESTT